MRVTIATALLAALSLAQGAFFECQAWGAAIPAIGSPDCEGLVYSGPTNYPSSPYAYVSGPYNGLCTMPVEGQGFLWLQGGGLAYSPPGGPFPRPASLHVSEVRVPIPAGAAAVSFWWSMEWDTNGGCYAPPPLACQPRNSGIDISVVGPSGARVLLLAYADAGSQPVTGPPYLSCLFPQWYIPQRVMAVLPALPPGSYLSLVTWRGLLRGTFLIGNVWHYGFVDAIAFSVPPAPLALSMISPMGSGSLEILLRNGAPAAPYLTLLTTNGGSFPNGALAGIDILPGELAAQLAFGAPPFQGLTDAAGTATYLHGPGILPVGVSLYGVSGNLDPATGILELSAPTAVTIL